MTLQAHAPTRPDLDTGQDPTTRRGLLFPWGTHFPDQGTLTEILPGIQWTRMRLPFALEFINVWVLEGPDDVCVVDTGLGMTETRKAWDAVLSPIVSDSKPLSRVFVTHMHPDHVGCAGHLCRKHGAELHMSRLEYVTCRMLVADTGREAPAAGMRFYREAGYDQAALDAYASRFGGFGKAVSRLPDSYTRLSEGDRFEAAGRSWQVVAGNGHSPEHASLLCEEAGVLISGDQVLPRISSNVSVHPTEPGADPLSDWLESIDTIKARLSDDLLVLPAHGEPFFGLHARLDRLKGGHERSLERLRATLSKGPAHVGDTFAAVFGRAIKDEERGLATGEAIAHLNYLIGRGEAVRRLENGLAVYEAA